MQEIRRQTMTSTKIYCLDATDWLQSLPNDSVDCIVTDPPYWSLEKHRAMGTTTRLQGDWFPVIDSEDLWIVMCEFERVLKKNCHAWVMCDHEVVPYILSYAREDNLFDYAKPYPVIKKTRDGSGIRQGMGYHGRCCHEYVVLLEKGRRRFSDENWPDVFQFPWTGDTESKRYTENGRPYPTAKPLALYRRLIELSTQPGDTVIDPYAGSGPLAEAATATGRIAMINDISEKAVSTCRMRAQEVLPL